jgi:hypothetical protein
MLSMKRNCYLLALCLLILPILSRAKQVKIEANVPIEFTLTSKKVHADPFNDVQVNVLFTQPDHATKLVPAFWDGGNTWKVRYASPVLGVHQWKSLCSDSSDPGLHGIDGSVSVAPYRGTNVLFQHGPIRVAPDKRHFEHQDGKPFFWLGDTWWMGLCRRLHFPADVQTLAADRKQKGFNVIQLVAGLYPDMHPFDPRGANETGYPWETNYSRIRPEYFDAADQRLRYLIDQGFTPCIVGAWGYFLPWMGVEKTKQHWRELIARYGSWPVVWCTAGEANLPWYLAKGFPYDDRDLVHGWTEVTRYIRATDPFHRLLTIHPTGLGKLNARWAIDDAALIDFDMLQTPHGQSDAVGPTIAAFQHAYQLLPAMPVLNGEASYEMLNGQIGSEWPRAMFWLCMINGAPGHTYGANGIWQVNRREQPHGASPHGGNYGTIPWDEAMNLPGSKQIGFARKFLESYSWERCVPQSETVKWQQLSPKTWGNWIWSGEGNAPVHAPVEPRFFRREFELPSDSKVKQAHLLVTADDKAEVWFNDTKLGEASDWRAAKEFDVSKLTRKGKNLLAIRAENLPASVQQNPAGLNVSLRLSANDHEETIVSDATWRVSDRLTEGWERRDFKDLDWPQAKVFAKYGEAPWGSLDQDNATFVPFALGMGEALRIVYAISPRALTVTGLRPHQKYQLADFDTVTGETKNQIITSDAKGSWVSPAPSHNHDRALALTLK